MGCPFKMGWGEEGAQTMHDLIKIEIKFSYKSTRKSKEKKKCVFVRIF